MIVWRADAVRLLVGLALAGPAWAEDRGVVPLDWDDTPGACDGLPPGPAGSATEVCLPLRAVVTADGALAIGVERVDTAWELWVGGRRVAGDGDPSTGAVQGSGSAARVALPVVVGAGGELRVVVRGWLSDRYAAVGGRYPWDGGAFVGPPGVVGGELARVAAASAVLAGQPRAIFTLVYLALATWHLMAVRLRRDLDAYGWYGATFALIAAWSAFDLVWRLGGLTYDVLHASRGLILVATAAYLRFLVVLLRRGAPTRAWRAVEAALVLAGLARLVTPWLSGPWGLPVVLLAGHVVAAAFVLREAARGTEEARVLAGGVGLLVLGVAVAVAERLWHLTDGVVARFAGDIGATTLAFSMALALGRRYAAALQERDDANASLRRTLAAATRFVPFGFLHELGAASIDGVKVGMSVEGEMSVLFADVRGFTARCEAMTPEETFGFVNRLVARLEPVVTTHGGFVDKFIGDAIMAVFPDQGGDAGAVRAVAAGVEMVRALEAHNAEERAAGRAPVAIGVGVHTGRLRLGTVGTAERMDGTVLGDTVNVAARVEAATRDHGVVMLITDATADRAPGVAVTGVGRVRLKGKAGEIGLLAIVGVG